MQSVKVDLRDVDKIDIQRVGKALPPAPPKRTLGDVERKALSASLEVLQLFNPQAAVFRYPIEMSENPPRVTIIPPSRVPVGLKPTSKSAATLALGFSAAAFAVAGISVSGGLYGSTTRELGVYTGGSAGLWTNVGASAGIQYTFVFGPPSDFAGVSWGVGCNVNGAIVGGGGLLLFSLPPIRCLGYSVSVGVGPTKLPFDLTVKVGITTTKPVLHFK